MKYGSVFAVGFVAALLLVDARLAAAQSPVSIKFEDGYVTLVARNAPVRTILAEWARVGGSRIINGDRVTGAPLTIEITHETERKALAILLRNVSGYAAVARTAAPSGASSLDRIHILPTPPPVQTAAAAAPRPAVTNPQPVVRFFPGDPNDDIPDDPVVVAPGVVTRPTPTTPPYTPPTAQPANSNATFGGGSSTFGMPTVTIPRQGDEAAERPQAPATRPTFPNAGGSGRPGEITAPPNQNQNQNPNQNQNQRPER